MSLSKYLGAPLSELIGRVLDALLEGDQHYGDLVDRAIK